MGIQLGKPLSVDSGKQDNSQINALRQQMAQRDKQINMIHQRQRQQQKEYQTLMREKDQKFITLMNQQLNASNQQKMRHKELKSKNRSENRAMQGFILFQQAMTNLNNQMAELQKQNFELMTRQPKVIFKPDPEMEKELDILKKSNKDQLLQIKKMNNPELMKQTKEKQLKKYIEYIGQRTKKWSQEFNNAGGLKHNIVVGDISAGKSSTLNYYYDLGLEVGVDETTMQASLVKQGQVCIWDSPGLNEKFDLMDLTTLKLFATAHRVFILFEKSLKCNKDDVKILAAVKQNKDIFVIRTMCDLFKDEADRQRALAKDKQILTEWGLGMIPIISTSNFKDMNTFDNKKFGQLLNS